MVEEKVRFTNGVFALISFKNKLARHHYVSEANRSEEIRVSVNGKAYTGARGGWIWKGGEASVLSQGEIQLVVTLQNNLLQVQKTYVVYPATSIIRQWVKYQNRSASAITVSDPIFLSLRLGLDETRKPTLHYMTGGGYFTGSQILKEVSFSSTYARTFDSTDKVERTTIGGLSYGDALPWGSGAYMPWFCIANGATGGEGLFAGFDYYGRWAAEIGNYFGGPGYLGFRLAGYTEDLAPGKSVQTPKAFTGVFTGDLDSMGNQLKDWQYRYMWDFTKDDYFAKIRFAMELRLRPGLGNVAWGGGTQDNWDYRLAEIFHMIDVLRYVGADLLWQDAGWYDRLGDNDGPDLAQVTCYLRKYGMGLTVWWPLYSVEKESRVAREHPDWLTNPSDPGGSNLDTSRKEVIDYLLGQLNEKVAKWGNFQWRLDGTAVVPVKGNETPMLAEYHNVTGLQREFRRLHPGCSIDVCSGGGNLMGYETLRVSDVSQLTDGGALYIANYYSSYLFPPDKIDDWTRDSNFTWNDARSGLTMAPAWNGDHGVFNAQPGIWINDGMENLRRNFEIYHYLVQQGVAGRWSQVYHPRVEGDDPVFYFERLSRDSKRGVIILKHFIRGMVKVYPKGLHAQETYDVRFEMSKRTDFRAGAELTKDGITLVNPQPGELIYIGLPNFPGSGKDHTAPSDPIDVKKKLGTNMGVSGVELEWGASTDNNWLSHYQIYRDGEMIDKVARGTYYFDHSNGGQNLPATYEVQAVDGDGNASRKVKAVQVEGGPGIFTARGGYLAGKDYSYQGANGWSYDTWIGSKHSAMMWNGALGHVGLYEGSEEGRKATIGASWLRPGDTADAVRVFTLPYSGQVTVTGSVHKDIYHTYGDGVRVKVLLGDKQVWPESGWQSIAANDITGKSMEIKTLVKEGEKLCFVVNCNVDSTDDDTVWNPQITYERIDGAAKPIHRTVVDDANGSIKYTGRGWQELGVSVTADQGYLPGRIRGTLKVSGTAGDKMIFGFHGVGVELLGDTGENRGIANIALDGKQIATIDTFVPEDGQLGPARIPIREPALWATVPSKRLWGIHGLEDGEHTLEVTVTGQKNRESTGTFIGIDAIVVVSGSTIGDGEK